MEPVLHNVSLTNAYVHGLFGKKIEKANASIALGVSWANLKGLDGVDLLYVNSQKIVQSGNMLDARLGIYKEFNRGQNFELLMLYNRFKMRHDVTYWRWGWMDDFSQNTSNEDIVRNDDRSNTFGLHLCYTQPLGKRGWLIGAIMTGNWKSHPKIPNYELQNIPRDPGDSEAYNIGFGISHLKKTVTFGFDMIYEPIWSNTWADAGEEIESVSGRIIKPGMP